MLTLQFEFHSYEMFDDAMIHQPSLFFISKVYPCFYGYLTSESELQIRGYGGLLNPLVLFRTLQCGLHQTILMNTNIIGFDIHLILVSMNTRIPVDIKSAILECLSGTKKIQRHCLPRM